jgi:hypothetical protein
LSTRTPIPWPARILFEHQGNCLFGFLVQLCAFIGSLGNGNGSAGLKNKQQDKKRCERRENAVPIAEAHVGVSVRLIAVRN